MKNFQTVVQELLHNHERQRRYIALLTALCMLMAFTVSIILIEPAESMTGELACGMSEHIHNENCFTYTCGQENDENHVHSAECRKLICEQTEHTHSAECISKSEEDNQDAQIMQINEPEIFDEPMAIAGETRILLDIEGNGTYGVYFTKTSPNAPQGAYDFGQNNNITGVSVKCEYSGSDTKQDEASKKWTITMPEDFKGDYADVKFTLSYSIGSSSVSLNQPYICYQIPEGVVIPENYFGANMTVMDKNYDDSIPAGYYYIDKESGMMVIRFTDDYIQSRLNNSAAFEGDITFDGQIKRANTSDGDNKVEVGGTEITVKFPEETFDISKSGQQFNDESGKPKVRWTITVYNYHTDTSWVGFELTDNYFPSDLGQVTVEPPTAVEQSSNPKGFKIKDNSAKQITFTFEETLTSENLVDNSKYSKTNEATLKGTYDSDGEKTFEESAESTVEISAEPTMNKSGKMDYSGKKAMIDWTIDVERPFNLPLSGYTVQDDALKGATDLKITSDAGTELQNGTDYTFNSGDGTITFSGSCDKSKVQITYQTAPNDSNLSIRDIYNGTYEVKNKACLKKGTDTIVPEKSASVIYSKNTLSKAGIYDPDTDEITWTVTSELGQDKSAVLDNYVLTDTGWKDVLLKDIDVVSASIYASENNYWSDHTLTAKYEPESDPERIGLYNGDTLYATITKNGENITINSVKNGDGSYTEGVGVDKIKLSYKQDVKGQSGTISNAVNDSEGNNITADATIQKREQVTKELTSTAKETVYGASEEKTETLNWKIVVTNDNGFVHGDDVKTLVDELSQPTNGEHYIPISATITVKGKSTATDNFDDHVLEAGKDYTITYYSDDKATTEITEGADKAKSFKITFTENVDTAQYHYIEVTYSTKADIPAFEANDKDTTLEFGNTAKFGKAPDFNSKYTYEHKSDAVEQIAVTVKKTWEGAEDTELQPIQFKLKRTKTNEPKTTEWKTTDGWGEEADAETFTLDSTSDWKMTFENLERDTGVGQHDDYYIYSAEEITTLKDFTVEYSDGVSKVTGQKFTITNRKNPSYSKKIIVDGKELAEGETIDVSKLDHDDDYYYVHYRIETKNYPQNYNNSKYVVLKDTLPENWSLVYDENVKGGSEYANHPHHPIVTDSKNVYNKYGMWRTSYTSENSFVIDGNTVTFCPALNYYIDYEIKIPISGMRTALLENSAEGYKFTNKIQEDGKDSVDATLTVTGTVEEPKPEEKDALKKQVNGDPSTNLADSTLALEGVISYSVYVNPEGKNLSNSDEFDILDALNLKDLNLPAGSELDRTKLKATLNQVTVEEITDYQNNNGKITSDTVRRLDGSEYQYNAEYDVTTTKTNEIILKFDSSGDGTYISNAANIDDTGGYYAVGGYKDEDEITLTLRGKPNTTIAHSIILPDKDRTNLQGKPFDEKGIYKITFTVYNPNEDRFYWNGAGIMIESAKGIRKEYISTTDDAQLTVTVPDETPLKVTYTYSLTIDGDPLPTGANLKATNKVSFDTGNATANDSKDDTLFYVSNSRANVTTGNSPKIVKYNIANASLTLNAEFYLAYYEDGKWIFADSIVSQVEELDDGKTGETRFVPKFDRKLTPLEGHPDGLPENCGKAQVVSGTEYKIYLEQNKLYKIVEVVAPEGFESSDESIKQLTGDTNATLESVLRKYLNNETISQNVENLMEKYVSTHYFTYETNPEELKASGKLPESFTGNIAEVHAGGTLGIPNNALINISAQKEWETGAGDNLSVHVKLYWSYKRSSTGYPSELYPATLEDLGLSSDYGNSSDDSIVIEPNGEKHEIEGDITGDSIITWTGLPNGKDDKPIYYYVKEMSYKIGEITYTLDENTGKYMNGSDEGPYKPTYSGNGTNKSSTEARAGTTSSNGTIKIRNSSGLYVRKLWKKSDNTNLTETEIPIDTGESIHFTLYGIKDNVKTEICKGVLNEKNGWNVKIAKEVEGLTFESSVLPLSQYDSFEVTEDRNESQTVKLYDFVISYNYNTSGGTGEITITNKDRTPINIDVNVTKRWSDGNALHGEDSVTVKLYSSTHSDLTDDQIKNKTGLTEVAGHSDITLNSTNNWTGTWEDLPYKNESGERLYYYAVEENVPAGCTAKYSRLDHSAEQTLTVSNTLPGKLTVQKQWLNSSGKQITAGLPESITVDLYSGVNVKSSGNAENKNSMKISAIGDSITAGYNSGSGNGYSKYLTSMLKDESYTITNAGGEISQHGYVNAKIELIKGYVGGTGLDNSYNTILLMAGTNDILHTNDDVDVIISHMKQLIEEVYTVGKNNDAVVYVGNIPKIKDINNSERVGYNDNSSDGEKQRRLNLYNDLVIEFNAKLKTFVESYTNHKVIYVDVYNAVGDNLNSDGIHPDDVGQENIANAFFTAINNYYHITPQSAKLEMNINRLPYDFYNADGSVNSKYTKIQEVTLTKEKKWIESLDLPLEENGNEYVYYIVEHNTNAWTAKYTGNGQTVTDGGTISLTNTVKTFGLNVEKKWSSTPSAGAAVELEIHRSTSPPTGQKLALGVQPSEEVVYNESGAIVVGYGGKLKLQANQENVKYSSSADFVTISDDGKITIGEQNDSNEKGDTEVTITITSENGKESKTIKLLVTNKLLVNPNSVTLAVGQSVTLKANKTVDNVDFDANSVEVNKDGEQITVIGKTTGTTILTVHSSDETYNVSVNVVAGLSVTPDRDTVVEGESFTVTHNRSDAVLSFNLPEGWYVNGNTITVGELTEESPQTITITATDDNMNDTATFSVTVNDFQIQNGEEFTLSNENGKTLDLRTNHTTAEGSIKWSCSGNDKITVNSSGVVSCNGAVGGESATITAEYTSADGNVKVSDTVKVTIVAAKEITINGYSGVYSGDTVVLELNEIISSGTENYDFPGLNEGITANLIPYKAEIELSQEPENSWYGYYCWLFGDNSNNGTVNGKTLTFTANTPKSFAEIGTHLGFSSSIPAIKITIYVRTATSGDSTTFETPGIEEISAPPQPRTISVSDDPTLVTKIRLTGTGGWTGAEDLPMYDESGNPYYYWIVESADSAAGYDVTYRYFDGDDKTEFDDTAINAENAGDATVVVTNTKTESSTTTMPSTGGNGAGKYYTIGGMLLMLSACGWAMRRRKRVIPH